LCSALRVAKLRCLRSRLHVVVECGGDSIPTMLRPLEQFRCDSCNGIIHDARDGWLEWYQIRQSGRTRGFHIVHRAERCAYDASQMLATGKDVTRVPLCDVVGSGALGYLLRRLDSMVSGAASKPPDVRLMVETIRRLQLRYYEEARLFWSMALRACVHDGVDYGEDVLRGIVEWKDAALTSGVAALVCARSPAPELGGPSVAPAD